MKRNIVMVLLLALACTLAVAQKSGEGQFSTLKFKVVREKSGKPVRNASVILHALKEDGKQEKGGLQLKTDADGEAEIRAIPYGKLRVQVIATGLRTYGEDIAIAEPEQVVTIKMQRPANQVSIYEKK